MSIPLAAGTVRFIVGLACRTSRYVGSVVGKTGIAHGTNRRRRIENLAGAGRRRWHAGHRGESVDAKKMQRMKIIGIFVDELAV